MTSEAKYSYLATTVGYIEVQTPYAPTSQAAGTPFSNQPKVKVYDQTGKLLAGKKVVAFTWNEPTFLSEATTNKIRGNRSPG